MLVNGAAQIEETATRFPQYALLHSLTCVQLRLITILGKCGCVAVASFLDVSSPLVEEQVVIHGHDGPILTKFRSHRITGFLDFFHRLVF
jgi:hypothetical protein